MVKKKEQTSKKPFKPVKRLKRNDLIAEQEKTKLWHKYKKMMRKEGRNVNDGKNKEAVKRGPNETGRNKKKPEEEEKKDGEAKFSKEKKATANKRAQIEYENKMKQKEKEREVCRFSHSKIKSKKWNFFLKERERKQLEKAEALKKYKKTKKEKFHKLCNKNKKGQALMGKQVDLLLKKIQANK